MNIALLTKWRIKYKHPSCDSLLKINCPSKLFSAHSKTLDIYFLVRHQQCKLVGETGSKWEVDNGKSVNRWSECDMLAEYPQLFRLCTEQQISVAEAWHRYNCEIPIKRRVRAGPMGIRPNSVR